MAPLVGYRLVLAVFNALSDSRRFSDSDTVAIAILALVITAVLAGLVAWAAWLDVLSARASLRALGFALGAIGVLGLVLTALLLLGAGSLRNAGDAAFVLVPIFAVGYCLPVGALCLAYVYPAWRLPVSIALAIGSGLAIWLWRGR